MKNRLRMLRADRYWTQRDLAVMVGSTRATISAVENGRREPGLSLAYRIAEAFETDIEEIFPNERGALERGPSRTVNLDLPNNLEALRTERLWSRAELARRLGIPVTRLASMERGRLLPDLLLAGEIAELFGKSLFDVFPYRAKASVRSGPPEAGPCASGPAAHEAL